MIIGVDFDNTIVCYDTVFHEAAVDRGWLAVETPRSKTAVRDQLRCEGREDAWTELQGWVYGHYIQHAEPFAGVADFFAACHRAGITVCVISHKTRRPFAGPHADLHEAARRWLAAQSFAGLPLDAADKRVFFEVTKEDKLARIAAAGCDWFIDDLPEFLAEPNFPPGVGKLLFDPHNLYDDVTGVRRATSWDQLTAWLLAEQPGRQRTTVPVDRPQTLPGDNERELHDGAEIASFEDERLGELAVRLLARSGYRGPYRFAAIPGGRNNRVYRVATREGDLLLKCYFADPRDPRPRLATEFGFCEFCRRHELPWVPQPIACDLDHHLGLYEFIHGRPLQAGEVTREHVTAAARFVEALHALQAAEDASNLPPASEACFRFADHLNLVARRVQRLVQIEAASGPVHAEAATFVRQELLPAWQQCRQHAETAAVRQRVELDEELPLADRCLSPSDFGFHNALVQPDGALRFVDFEYAGWDDPAKLISDFYCQPKVPAPIAMFEDFAAAATMHCERPVETRARAAILLPVYRLKWCCIALNEFLPVEEARRAFSGISRDPLRLEKQLDVARDLLRRTQAR